MKRSIDVIEHAGEIMKKVNDAVLLTTKKDGQVNAMTISWGGMAIEWGTPLFITSVRESRLMCRAFASFPLRWSAASCSSRNRILPILMPRTRKSGIPLMKRWVAPTNTRPITPKSWRPTLSSSSGYSTLCAGAPASLFRHAPMY